MIRGGAGRPRAHPSPRDTGRLERAVVRESRIPRGDEEGAETDLDRAIRRTN
jgi:hypothetical protein